MRTFTFFTTCLIAIICMGLTSCSKDDDKESDNIAIKGAWYSEEEKEGIAFDGKGNGYSYHEGDELEFTYKLNGNKLTITDEEGDTYSATIHINGNTLKVTTGSKTKTYKRVDTEDE